MVSTILVLQIAMTSFYSIFATLLLFIAVIGILCLLTGKTPRSYVVHTPSDQVVVAGNTITMQQLAISFQPQLFQRPDTVSPPALAMWWEAIDTDDSIALVYHAVWKDERHPVPILHWIYYFYRAIVYGIPVRDIEYIQINVNRSDGLINRVRYEDSSATSYEDATGRHIQITIERRHQDYIETRTFSTKEQKTKHIKLCQPLVFGIATWGHQFVLIADSASHYTIPVHMPLEYLTEHNYTGYKLARRSQGDFATDESVLGRIATSIFRIIVLGPFYILSSI